MKLGMRGFDKLCVYAAEIVNKVLENASSKEN